MTALHVPSPDPSAGQDATAVIGRRTVAWLLDLLIYLGVSAAVFAAVAEYVEVPSGIQAFDACRLLQDQDPEAAAGCIEIGDRAYLTSESDNAVQALASLGYFAVFVLLQGAGASPGKFLTGLRVVGPDGRAAGVGRSLVRTIMWVVDGAPWFLPLVGFITGLTTTGHRRVGDMVANTYVIRARDTGAPVVTGGAAMPPPAQSQWGAASPSPPPSPSHPTSVRPSTEPSAEEVDSLVPEIPNVAGERPAPPPMLDDQRPAWEPPGLDDVIAPPPEVGQGPVEGSAVAEAYEAADIGAPEVPPDPDWWAGPEAEPSTTEVPEDPGMPEWTDDSGIRSPTDVVDHGDVWSPPSTPTSEMGHAGDASPTAGPPPLSAPGADPTQEAPAPPDEPPLPPPQWDATRNTYLQWDPRIQSWLYWDDVGAQWRRLEG